MVAQTIADYQIEASVEVLQLLLDLVQAPPGRQRGLDRDLADVVREQFGGDVQDVELGVGGVLGEPGEGAGVQWAHQLEPTVDLGIFLPIRPRARVHLLNPKGVFRRAYPIREGGGDWSTPDYFLKRIVNGAARDRDNREWGGS